MKLLRVSMLSASLLIFAVPNVALSQSSPEQKQVESAIQVLKSLNNAAPDVQTPDDGVRARGGSAVDPDVLDSLADASLEFLSKYAIDRVIYGEDNRKNYSDQGVSDSERRAA